MSKEIALLAEARSIYHADLIANQIFTINASGCPSNADSSNADSVNFAKGIYDKLLNDEHQKERAAAQTSGSKFETVNLRFLQRVLPKLKDLRPGDFQVIKLGNRNKRGISNFEQYAHLADLERLSRQNSELAASLGNGYLVGPDLIIYRDPLPDEIINENGLIVDSSCALKAILRKSNGGKQILHASVSSKWTMRSDRAQNSRTEALNLIRNRKGHLPHIVDITAEPLPSRIASLALGTGDIDCVYHSFLYELIDVVNRTGSDDSKELLNVMVEGKRLKDISDLPLDLMI